MLSVPRLESADLRGMWPPSASARGLALLLALVFLSKIALALGLPLISDELYYRMWALSPQWGYLDHPPMIAWWILIGEAMLGDHQLGTRILPVLSSFVASFGLYAIIREFGLDRVVARKAVIWAHSVWMFAACGMLATPDSPAALFWILALFCAARASNRESLRWWIAAGVMTGLGYLSKYTCFFIGFGVFFWLLFSPPRRHQLGTPGPWLAQMVAIVVFVPNLMWNAANDWGTFGMQVGRAVPDHFTLLGPVALVAWQLLLLGPLLFVLAALAIRDRGKDKLTRRRAGASACAHLLIFTSVPLVVYMLFHSLHSEIRWNWLAPILANAAVLALLGSRDDARRQREVRIDAAVPLSAAAALAIAALIFFTPLTHRFFDANSDTRQWPEVEAQLAAAAGEHGAAWIGTGHYWTNALLQSYRQTAPPVVQIAERQRYPSNDPSWRIDPGAPGLIMESAGQLDEDGLGRCFDHVEKLESVQRVNAAGQVFVYEVFSVAGQSRPWLRDGCPAVRGSVKEASPR